MQSRNAGTMEDAFESVRPDGGEVRRRRVENGWGPSKLISEIARAHRIATGLVETISPVLLRNIEDANEIVPYETLCLIADGLDCDPIDILLPEEDEEDADD